MSEPTLTIDELATAAHLPSRTIRFYQTKGLLLRPELRGRVAFYGEAHVERLKLVAALQDRGLQIKAICALVERIDKGEVTLQEWLGLEDQLEQPWANDQPRLLDQAALVALAGELRPGRLADLARVGLVERRSDAFLVPSPALLQLAVRLEGAGVELDVVAAASRLLRKRMARTAEDLAKLFLARSGKRARGGPPGEALRELRPIALDAVRLVFAQEMERVLREWIDSGRTAKMPR
jgi:DNA-binding transcriptional MerR regulator